MHKNKYLIYKMLNGNEKAIIFDASIFHNEISIGQTAKVVGAGFVDIRAVTLSNHSQGGEKFRVNCYGESSSLEISSRGLVDSNIIKEQLSR